jgi:hypothetical protein|tara:strand:+ start:900 stop:1100 length:201 start_codon:yes stop_codon:yes gene_type:complete
MENWYNVEVYRAADNGWMLISSNKYWDVALKIAKRERDEYKKYVRISQTIKGKPSVYYCDDGLPLV